MNEYIRIFKFDRCLGKHSHKYPQIMIPIEKPMHVCIGDNQYDVTQEEICYVPANEPHECSYYGKLIALNFSEDFFSADDSSFLSHPIVVPMQGQILQLISVIQAELTQNPNSSSVHYLYNYLYSKLLESHHSPSLQYINLNYNQPLSVETLAKIENYSVSYYNNWFKRQFGVSPGIFLRQKRIRVAQDLLERTDYSITKIARMVGYDRYSSFSRTFYSMVGTSPKEYREKESSNNTAHSF